MAKRIPWIIKYRPKKLDDVVNQDKAKTEFILWLKSWLAGRPSKKAALLYGPAGCGKTSLVEAAANEFRLELVEMNASDFRRRQDIERIALTAAQQRSLFSRGKIILLDEVDGISGTADRGALDAILHLIEVSRYPIVMTANDPWDPKLRPLRDTAKLISFNRLRETHVLIVLKRICAMERLVCEDDALKLIAKRSEGDLRSAINDLQSIGQGYGKVTVALAQNLLTYRYREYTPFEALRMLFNAKYVWQAKAAVSQANLDYDMLMQWINENIPNYYSDPEEIWKAYEALSRASVYLGRIIRSGSWDLLSYVFDMLGPSIAFARKTYRYKWAKFKFPERITLLAKTKRSREIRDGIARALAPRLLSSRKRILSDEIPYLHAIFQVNPEYGVRIALGYGLTEDMVKYLAGPRSSEALIYYRKLMKR